MSETEEWRQLPTPYSDYEASSFGRIRSWKRVVDRLWKPHIKAFINRHGYNYVSLRSDGGAEKSIRVSKLVALVFKVTKPFPSAILRHRNGNKKDDTPSNLLWGSYLDNESDKRRHHATDGVYAPNPTLTVEQVLDIVRRVSLGETSESAGLRYGVSDRAIRDIMQGKTHSSTTGIRCAPSKLNEREHMRKLENKLGDVFDLVNGVGDNVPSIHTELINAHVTKLVSSISTDSQEGMEEAAAELVSDIVHLLRGRNKTLSSVCWAYIGSKESTQ